MAHLRSFSILIMIFLIKLSSKHFTMFCFGQLNGINSFLEVFVWKRNSSIFIVENYIFRLCHTPWDFFNGIPKKLLSLFLKVEHNFFLHIFFEILKLFFFFAIKFARYSLAFYTLLWSINVSLIKISFFCLFYLEAKINWNIRQRKIWSRKLQY